MKVRDTGNQSQQGDRKGRPYHDTPIPPVRQFHRPTQGDRKGRPYHDTDSSRHGRGDPCGRPVSDRSGNGLFPLLIAAMLFELLYLLVFALVPLPGLHLYSTPLPDVWAWTLAPSRWLFADAWKTQLASTGTFYDWPHVFVFGGTLLALVGTYAFAVVGVWRAKREGAIVGAGSRWLLLLLGGAVVFGLTLLFLPRLFSDDVFTYIFSGRILSIYHLDPLNTAPFQFPGDSYLRWVISGRGTPNIYGPFWLLITSLLVGISANAGPVTTLLLFKGVALLSHLVNCVLIWLILSKLAPLAPAHRLLGTLLYAWNPLALLELAGMGHNEGVLLTLLLLAVCLHVWGEGQENNRWYEIGVLVLLGLAVSTNLVALLIAPLYVWFVVRSEQNIARAVWAFSWRMGFMLACMLLIYLPFWRGASTFFAITSAIDMEHFVHSPPGILVGPMRSFFRQVAQWSHFPPVMQPNTAADLTLRGSATFIFVLIYLRLLGQVRLAPVTSPASDQEIRLPGFGVLLTGWCSAVLAYLLLVSGWFWPWFVLWVLWIVVLRRLDRLSIAVLLLSGTALLAYPLMNFTRRPAMVGLPLLIFGIPLVYFLTVSLMRRSRRGRTERNEVVL